MKLSLEELKLAYIKLKSHIYYDTTELFQRKKLAIFETGLLDGDMAFLTKKSRYGESIFNLNVIIEDKLQQILDEINNHDKDKSFDSLLDEIDLLYLPKNFKKIDECENFLSNQRVFENYDLDRVTVFADIPIELHLVTIVWLLKHGYKLDAKLNDNCLGNRLILNKNKDSIVKGSGLFKPYFSQYQKWRDQSVEEAQLRLKKGNKVAFINLDIKDYFYSVRLNFEDIEKLYNKTKFELEQAKKSFEIGEKVKIVETCKRGCCVENSYEGIIVGITDTRYKVQSEKHLYNNVYGGDMERI